MRYRETSFRLEISRELFFDFIKMKMRRGSDSKQSGTAKLRRVSTGNKLKLRSVQWVGSAALHGRDKEELGL